MDVNEDFVDIAQGFIDNGVEFEAREQHSPASVARTGRCPLLFAGSRAVPVAAHGVTQEDFEVEDKVYQLGLPPRRIDILTSISGVTFDEAVAEAIEGRLGPVKVRFIGKALHFGAAGDDWGTIARDCWRPQPW